MDEVMVKSLTPQNKNSQSIAIAGNLTQPDLRNTVVYVVSNGTFGTIQSSILYSDCTNSTKDVTQ